jgi:ADP-ribose pyrophosphatase
MPERSATLLSTQTIHTGRVFTTTRDRIQLPDGRETTMDVIRHQPSVILLPMPDTAHIVLVRQYRYTINRWTWELPAGHVEPGENIKTAARRECHEEIGQVPDRIECLAELYPTPGSSDEVMIFLRLIGFSTPTETAKLDEDEILKPKLFALTDVMAQIERGEIRDMKTALGIRMLPAPDSYS